LVLQDAHPGIEQTPSEQQPMLQHDALIEQDDRFDGAGVEASARIEKTDATANVISFRFI
jgi:hypothetical protein